MYVLRHEIKKIRKITTPGTHHFHFMPSVLNYKTVTNPIREIRLTPAKMKSRKESIQSWSQEFCSGAATSREIAVHHQLACSVSRNIWPQMLPILPDMAIFVKTMRTVYNPKSREILS